MNDWFIRLNAPSKNSLSEIKHGKESVDNDNKHAVDCYWNVSEQSLSRTAIWRAGTELECERAPCPRDFYTAALGVPARFFFALNKMAN